MIKQDMNYIWIQLKDMNIHLIQVENEQFISKCDVCSA